MFNESVGTVCCLAFTCVVLLKFWWLLLLFSFKKKTTQNHHHQNPKKPTQTTPKTQTQPKTNLRVGTRLPPVTKENGNLKKGRAKEELINKCQSTLSFTYQLLASMSSRFYLHTMEMIYFLLKRSGLADI